MATVKTRWQKKLLSDFSGGLNTLLAPNEIKDNESPTCQNVWHETGALKKRRGYTQAQVSIDGVNLTRNASPHGFINNLGNKYLIQLAYTGAATTNFVPMQAATTPIQYNTGTVSTTAGSGTVTGSGTLWASLNFVANNGVIKFVGDNAFYKVTAVGSDTSLTITPTAAGNLNGVAYHFMPMQSLQFTSYASLKANLYLSQTSNTVISSDGTTWTHLAAFPPSWVILTHKNYMFAFNQAGATTIARGRWSNLLDPTTWPSSNFQDFSPQDGQPIEGAFSDGDSIIVLKDRKAFKMTGDIFDPNNPSWTVAQMHTPPEAVFTSAKTVQIFDGSYLIFAKQGIYRYDGGSAIYRVEKFDNLQPDWDAIAFPSPVSGVGSIYLGYADSNSGITYKGRYWLGLNTANGKDGPDIQYTIDRNGATWKWNNSTVVTADLAMFGQMEFSNGVLYGVSGGWIKTLDTGTADGTVAINASWTSKVFQFPEKQNFGACYVMYKKQSTGNLTFSYSVDEGAFTNVTIDMTTGSATRTKSAPMVIGQAGYSIQFKVANNTTTDDFEIYGIEFSHIAQDN